MLPFLRDGLFLPRLGFKQSALTMYGLATCHLASGTETPTGFVAPCYGPLVLFNPKVRCCLTHVAWVRLCSRTAEDRAPLWAHTTYAFTSWQISSSGKMTDLRPLGGTSGRP